jgi:monodehydroascorbate reductase (NADH)
MMKNANNVLGGKQRKIVIVGAGNSSGYLIKHLLDAERMSEFLITLVGEESVLPYERPALTKAFLHKEQPARLPGFHTSVGSGFERQSLEWYEQKRCEVFLNERVIRCDFGEKFVETHKGRKISYDSLVVATGVSANKATFIEGYERGIVLRSHEDALKVVNALDEEPKNPVIIGGGYIGLEVCAAMLHRGLKPTVVLMESNVMARVFTAEIAKYYEDLYEQKGCTFIKNASVKKINENSCVLSDGTEIQSDLVIIGVGSDVKPNVLPFEGLLERAADGGIKVDGHFRTSEKDVYAIGDVCSFPVRLQKPDDSETHARMEHVKHARQSAMHCAKCIVEGHANVPAYKYEPFFYSRVFEQKGSERPVTWQFYGFTGTKDSTKIIGPIGDFKPKLINLWFDSSTNTLIGAFIESGSPQENDAIKLACERNYSLSIDDQQELSKPSTTVALAIEILAKYK